MIRKGTRVKITAPTGHVQYAWLVKVVRWDRDVYVVRDHAGFEATVPDGWRVERAEGES